MTWTSTPCASMSWRRSAGVKRTLGDTKPCRLPPPTMTPTPSPGSWRNPCHSLPASAARQSACGTRCAWMSIVRIGWALYLARAEVLVQEVHRPLPGERGGSAVVARRGVVVEAVLRAGIAVHRVRDLARLQRGLIGGPARIDPVVVVGVVDQQRGLDPRGL